MATIFTDPEAVKKGYTAPQLVVHGTLEDITLMRFNWHPRRPGDWKKEEPYVNVS